MGRGAGRMARCESSAAFAAELSRHAIPQPLVPPSFLLLLEECVPIAIKAAQSLPIPHTWSKYHLRMIHWRYVLKGGAQSHMFSTGFLYELNCILCCCMDGCKNQVNRVE